MTKNFTSEVIASEGSVKGHHCYFHLSPNSSLVVTG